MTTYNLFTTPVKIISFPNFEEINKKIGKAMTLGFKNNFTDNLPEDEAKEIQKVFLNEVELYLKELTNKKIDLRMSKSWTTYTEQYGFNSPHEHFGNIALGVYYIKTFDKCGDLLLHDPRGANGFVPQYEVNTQGALVSGRNYIRITPKTGDLVIFPAYIIHSVEPNMSEVSRISLAMNFNYLDFEQFRSNPRTTEIDNFKK